MDGKQFTEVWSPQEFRRAVTEARAARVPQRTEPAPVIDLFSRERIR